MNIPKDYLYKKKIKKFIKQKLANVYTELENRKHKSSAPPTILYFPFEKEKDSYLIAKSKTNHSVCEQGLPIPPKDLWLSYGDTEEEYLLGKENIEALLGILDNSGFTLKENHRVLDFGCGAGRMIRWLKPYSEKCEIWGTDISSEHIYWAKNYLKPPFNFATTTTVPHLPFEDNYFDLIYAGSVFTHIDDLTDAWLLELRRIISKDGRIFITIHDKHSIELLNKFRVWRESWITKYLNDSALYQENKNDFNVFVGLRGPSSQVFYDIEYFCNSVKNIYEVLSVTQEVYGYQTGVLLKKNIKLNLTVS
ncbi:MAG: class I SAM-dependent methyltransferase [bacterium]